MTLFYLDIIPGKFVVTNYSIGATNFENSEKIIISKILKMLRYLVIYVPM